jgi:hypothetical protein
VEVIARAPTAGHVINDGDDIIFIVRDTRPTMETEAEIATTAVTRRCFIENLTFRREPTR